MRANHIDHHQIGGAKFHVTIRETRSRGPHSEPIVKQSPPLHEGAGLRRLVQEPSMTSQ
jgi:hypothetical protein